MPNWCENEVTISGKASELVRFKEHVRGKSAHNQTVSFSFHEILPMPNDLRGTSSPASIVTKKQYDDWMKSAYEKRRQQELEVDYTVDMEIIDGRPITEAMSNRFIKKYGSDNWYDWSVDNWGTKWDNNEDSVSFSEDSENLYYDFDTAWEPPQGIYNALAKEFPTLDITWQYEEPSMGLSGYLEIDADFDNQISSMEMSKKIADLVKGVKVRELST